MSAAEDYCNAIAKETRANEDKQAELTALSIWLTEKIGFLTATGVTCLISGEWSEDQGVFGEQHGIETIYYEDWHISYDKSGKFKFENLAVGSDDETFYSYLLDGLKKLGL